MYHFFFAGLCLLSSLCPNQAVSQSANDFLWQGDTAFFIKTQTGFQANGAKSTGQLCIWKHYERTTNTVWEWSLQMDFNPSASNYVRLYLIADKPFNNPELKGFYLKVGGSSGSLDAIDLFYQDGNQHTQLTRGVAGFIGQEKVDVRIKAELLKDNFWRINADSTGGFSYISQGGAEVLCNIESGYTGVMFFHTSTRADKFILKSISVDSAPIAIIDTQIRNESEFIVLMSEEIKNLNSDHIRINSEKPDYVHCNKDSIIIRGDFLLKNAYNTLIITIPWLEEYLEYNFYFAPYLAYASLIFNEIMPAPSAISGLPNSEYIELLNRSTSPVQLFSFTLSDRQTYSEIQDSIIIKPDSILILCPANAVSDFKIYGQALGLTPWPSLNNDHDDIYLRDPADRIIFALSYSNEWHSDKKASAGGFALEAIAPDGFCLGKANWQTSTNPKGGSPGKTNSQYVPDYHNILPNTMSSSINNNTITLTLDRNPDWNQYSTAFINNSIVPNVAADQNSIILEAPFLLQSNSIYSVILKKLGNCVGYINEDFFHEIIYTTDPDSLDLVFNEVMFNPDSDGPEFIELYNQSDNYINLKIINLQYQNTESLTQTSFPVSHDDNVMIPHSYAVLTRDSGSLVRKYTNAVNEAIIEMPRFPALNNKNARLTLSSANRILDDFTYNESYHHSILSSAKGVSLERISSASPTNLPQNWTSAASTSFYATPGFRNSQARSTNGDNRLLSISPDIFTPDGDGIDDFIIISLTLPSENWIASVRIFDMNGRLIKRLSNNQSPGTANILTWDGSNDSGSMAGIGIYIIAAELYNLDGQVNLFKETVVVGGRL